ncbi:MAG TPA: hypothetical protein PLD56_12595 [Chitinophagales bacterium]|nr:hypothetical protein [Chitinophagales bacterium]
MTTIKNQIITAFKNSCVLLDPRLVMKRSISVKYQFQRNIWEIDTIYGLVRIEDEVKRHSLKLFPLLGNGFHLKKETVFEITKNEYDELRKLYFGEFKEDKNYLNKYYGI